MLVVPLISLNHKPKFLIPSLTGNNSCFMEITKEILSALMCWRMLEIL